MNDLFFINAIFFACFIVRSILTSAVDKFLVLFPLVMRVWRSLCAVSTAERSSGQLGLVSAGVSLAVSVSGTAYVSVLVELPTISNCFSVF